MQFLRIEASFAAAFILLGTWLTAGIIRLNEMKFYEVHDLPFATVYHALKYASRVVSGHILSHVGKMI